jgi:hypothetical protein
MGPFWPKKNTSYKNKGYSFCSENYEKRNKFFKDVILNLLT